MIVGPKEEGLEVGVKEKKPWNRELEAAAGGTCEVWLFSLDSVRGTLKEQSCLQSGQEADLMVNQGSIKNELISLHCQSTEFINGRIAYQCIHNGTRVHKVAF